MQAPAFCFLLASAERVHLAQRYLRGAIIWGTVADLWLMLALAWLAFSGRAARMRTWIARRRQRLWIQMALFAAFFVIFTFVADFPFSVYLGFFRERAYGFEHLGLWGWLGDWGKSLLVSVIFGVITVVVVYAVLRRTRRWWLWVWAVCVLLAIVAVAVEPVFIEPLFNQFTPIKDQSLRQRILAMAHRAGIPAKEVYEVDRSRQSGHTNAYVVGLLGTERIVIYDTLLKAETPDEVEFVMGHEMGHYVLHHIWKGFAVFAGVSLGLFWIGQYVFYWAERRWNDRLRLTGVGDIASLPLLALILLVLIFFATPLDNWFSRREEHQADAFGLAISPNPAAAITSFEKDVDTDLIDPDPPRWMEVWFFTHPSTRHRIEFAEAYCRTHGISFTAENAEDTEKGKTQ